jgi:hypothetical protein
VTGWLYLVLAKLIPSNAACGTWNVPSRCNSCKFRETAEGKTRIQISACRDKIRKRFGSAAVKRMGIAPIMLAAGLVSAAPCHAGPCTAQIAQVEQQIAQSRANAALQGAGTPTAAQTLGAQLHRQPTPESVQSAQNKAGADAAAALDRARKADAAGDAAACAKALNDAKQIYGIE